MFVQPYHFKQIWQLESDYNRKQNYFWQRKLY